MQIDENWNYNESEINEYAEYIGINPVKEKSLLWIAKEGIKAPLPPNWRAMSDDSGDIYYENTVTGEKMIDHPLDDEYKQKVILEREKESKGENFSPSSTGSLLIPPMNSVQEKDQEEESLNTNNAAGMPDSYIPDPEEIRGYAEYIGINPDTEPELLSIAIEGLKSPVPMGYEAEPDAQGNIQYRNLKTGELSYDHPLDDVFRQKVIDTRNKLHEAKSSKESKAPAEQPDKISFEEIKNEVMNSSLPPPEDDDFEEEPDALEEEQRITNIQNTMNKENKKEPVQEIPPFKERAKAPEPASELAFEESPAVELSVSNEANFGQILPESIDQLKGNLENDFSNEIIKLTNDHADEIKKILRSESLEISERNNRHEKEMRELEIDCENEIQEIKEKHEAELQSIKKELNNEWITAQKEEFSKSFEVEKQPEEHEEYYSEEQEQLLAETQPQYIDIFSELANIIIFALPNPFKAALLHQKYVIYLVSQQLSKLKPNIDLEITSLEAKRQSFTAEKELLEYNDKDKEKELYKERKQLDTESKQISSQIENFKAAQRYLRQWKAAVEHIFDSLNLLPSYPQIYEYAMQLQLTESAKANLFNFAVDTNGWIEMPLESLDESMRVEPVIEDLQRLILQLLKNEETIILEGLSDIIEESSFNENTIYEMIESFADREVAIGSEAPELIVELLRENGLCNRTKEQYEHENNLSEKYNWMDNFKRDMM